ncbi:AURKAIP1/COX24 domain-containing protein [archaeon]|nr:MAG: AURKAIP1/COX24 domain-containing protein [archaeon]
MVLLACSWRGAVNFVAAKSRACIREMLRLGYCSVMLARRVAGAGSLSGRLPNFVSHTLKSIPSTSGANFIVSKPYSSMCPSIFSQGWSRMVNNVSADPCRQISTRKRRTTKMNKHKLRKRRKANRMNTKQSRL